MRDPRADQADALLNQWRRERGAQLKVFLGAAPGVGKTYAMLQAAQELRQQGVDVVVGVVETHGRADTEALLAGLETLPRRPVPYKGHVLAEFDLDAALARRPTVLIVDELAHSNAPGSRHPRRYQDVEELLAAGISVYTAVNIQHLESLNDVVHQITGVKVRETVPDAFLDRLQDLVLIDLPPRELIERLRQGKVYLPDQAAAALSAYFSPSNLMALRELAMQTAADRVDADLREHLRAHGGDGVISIRRRVLLALDGQAESEYLVRMARRIAERRQAPWTVVHVDTGRGQNAAVVAHLHDAFQLARRLGADTATLHGHSVVHELLAYARAHGVSTLVIGRTRERPFARMFNRTLTQQLLQKGAHFELTIVAMPEARARARRWWARRRLEPAPPPNELAREFLVATGAVLAALALAFVARQVLEAASLALIFLVAVVAVAVRSRYSAALYAAVLSFLAYNFFFTEPYFTLTISREEDLLAVVTFLLAALVCSQLAHRLRTQMLGAQGAHRHTRVLQALAQQLAAAAEAGQVLRTGASALAGALGVSVVVLTRGEGQSDLSLHLTTGDPPLDPSDLAAADWSATHGLPAGWSTDTLASSAWWFVPLDPGPHTRTVLGLHRGPTSAAWPASRQDLARAMLRDTSEALQRAQLVAELQAVRMESETDRLRTALLSSVSHDLRSPLASMIGAAGSLAAYGSGMPAEDREALLQSILDEGRRLDRYIQNLLDMTQLGHGTLQLRRDWIDLAEILAAVAGRLNKLAPSARLQQSAPPTPLWLHVHPALIEQALFNILENAARFSPPGEAVTLSAEVYDGSLRIDISDRGPGIPPAERARIFDMFYRVRRGDENPDAGTGLGLTIAQGMVGAHGGKVEALAGPEGLGTTIRVTLPLPRDAPPPATDDDP